MKILMLDIDGVLNGTDDWIEWKLFGHPINFSTQMLNRTKLAMLAYIIKETGTKLVLSSTWRNQYSLEQMIDLFREHGFNINFDILIDKTPPRRMDGCRGYEIQEWLAKHPEVTKYVILDDSADFLQYQFEHLVRTDSYVGMTFHDMIKVIQKLNDEPKEIVEHRADLF